MSRPLRIAFPGGVHHVTSRGDRREPIFLDDRDRGRMLGVLAQAMHRFDAGVLAYCLMGNHYHFVLHTKRDNLSQLMRHINGVYAQAFNRRHDLSGHVFQGRFTSIHVDRDAYLMEVCRYTELNPVRAGLVGTAGEWPWSSYAAHCGLVESPTWLDTAALHGCLLGRDAHSRADRLLAARIYIGLVEEGRAIRLWERTRQEIYLGDDAFVARIQASMKLGARADVEVPRVQRRGSAPLSSWFQEGCSRDDAICRAHVDRGVSMTEIARALGLSVSRVSRVVKQMQLPLRHVASAHGTRHQPARITGGSRQDKELARSGAGRQKARPDPHQKAKGKT